MASPLSRKGKDDRDTAQFLAGQRPHPFRRRKRSRIQVIQRDDPRLVRKARKQVLSALRINYLIPPPNDALRTSHAVSYGRIVLKNIHRSDDVLEGQLRRWIIRTARRKGRPSRGMRKHVRNQKASSSRSR
jgi:hypothetical protein